MFILTIIVMSLFFCVLRHLSIISDGAVLLEILNLLFSVADILLEISQKVAYAFGIGPSNVAYDEVCRKI